MLNVRASDLRTYYVASREPRFSRPSRFLINIRPLHWVIADRLLYRPLHCCGGDEAAAGMCGRRSETEYRARKWDPREPG